MLFFLDLFVFVPLGAFLIQFCFRPITTFPPNPESNPEDTTAGRVAYARAMESARPETQRMFFDPYAYDMIGEDLQWQVNQMNISDPTRGNSFFDWIVVRTKCIDDAINHAILEGVKQVIILGAGYDTRAYRLAPATYFEVDRPVVSRKKRKKYAALGLTGATLIECDFMKDTVEQCLQRGGIQHNQHTLVLWEGVTMYLTEEAIKATFNAMAMFAKFQMIFTYANKTIFDSPLHSAFLDTCATVGEPWLHGFDKDELPYFLEPFGLDVINDVGGEEVATLVKYNRETRTKVEDVVERIVIARRKQGS